MTPVIVTPPSPTISMLDNIREDDNLSPEEKQLSFTSAKADNEFTVFAEVGSIMKSMMRNPTITVTDIRVKGEGWMTPEEYDDGPIVSIKAIVPKGTMKIGQHPRNSNQHHQIVSDR